VGAQVAARCARCSKVGSTCLAHPHCLQARTLGPWSSAVELVNAREKAAEQRKARLASQQLAGTILGVPHLEDRMAATQQHGSEACCLVTLPTLQMRMLRVRAQAQRLRNGCPSATHLWGSDLEQWCLHCALCALMYWLNTLTVWNRCLVCQTAFGQRWLQRCVRSAPSHLRRVCAMALARARVLLVEWLMFTCGRCRRKVPVWALPNAVPSAASHHNPRPSLHTVLRCGTGGVNVCVGCTQ
jgi:hypothetical protein